jgi:diguanylate cyclase
LLSTRIEAVRSDIVALQEAAGAVRRACEADPVTHLPGRTAFERELAAAAARPASDGTRLGLLLCNLDYFGEINAAHGPVCADRVLRIVGMLLRSHAPRDACVARLEADAFGLVLPHTQAGTAHEFAEGVRQVLMAKEIAVGGDGSPIGRLTMSVGVAMLLPGEGAASLLERCAGALVVAKREGRNRVVEMTAEGPVWKADRRT